MPVQSAISMAGNALSMIISSATPALQAAAKKDGHPEMVELVTALASGSASLQVTITPAWDSDGSGVVATELSGVIVLACHRHKDHVKITA